MALALCLLALMRACICGLCYSNHYLINMKKFKLSILIPSVGEPASFNLLQQIYDHLRPNNSFESNIELLILATGCDANILPCYDDSPNVRVLFSALRKGASIARNTLASEANGEFLLFCDADSFIISPKNFILQISALVELLDSVSSKTCLVYSDLPDCRLSPFKFRLREWNFIIPRDLFLCVGGFPDYFGLGSNLYAQCGESQFLFHELYLHNVNFISTSYLFGHPKIGTKSESFELLTEKKLSKYNYGASFSALILFLQRFSSLSAFHLCSHIFSTLLLFPKSVINPVLCSHMLFGRIYGFIAAFAFHCRFRSLNSFYSKQ